MDFVVRTSDGWEPACTLWEELCKLHLSFSQEMFSFLDFLMVQTLFGLLEKFTCRAVTFNLMRRQKLALIYGQKSYITLMVLTTY